MLKKVSVLTVALFVAMISLTAAQTNTLTNDDGVYRGGRVHSGFCVKNPAVCKVRPAVDSPDIRW